MCRRRPLTAAVLAAVATGVAAAPSSAATLHADPSSTRAAMPCAAETPCKLDYALAAAGAGDDVRLAPGDYYAAGTTPYAGLPDVRSGITVHGDPALPLPVLHGHMAANATPFIRIQNTGVLRDVALDVGSTPGLTYSYAVMITPGALLDRALVRSRGTAGVNTTACSMVGGTVTNTACLGTGPGTVNALTGTASANTVYTVRNATAITTAASGDGIRVGVSSFTSAMNVTNSIARGITSDVASRAGLAGGDVTLNLTNSNWNAQSSGGAGTARIVNGGGNQYGPTAAVPLFADAAAGDYRPVAGSPTIDAGVSDPLNGPLALGGAPRVVGATTDIGAFEFVPPPPAPPPPAAPEAPAPPPAAPTPMDPPVNATADTLAPTISAVAIGRRWRVGTKLTPAKRGRLATGATLRFRLSEPARTTVTISQPATGRRVSGRCKPVTKATRRKPTCRISNVRATLRVSGKAGTNAVRITGKMGRTTLKPGPYVVTVSAIDTAGNRAAPKTARFTISR